LNWTTACACALHWLQSLEPTGVGARACSRMPGPAAAHSHPGLRRAPAGRWRICEHHLDLLAKRDIKRLTALTGADEDLVREAQALIVACEPKPGRPFAGRRQHHRARRDRAQAGRG
jgi:RNA polymerase sigma-54 factor